MSEFNVSDDLAERLSACYRRLIELGRRRKARLAQRETVGVPRGSPATDTATVVATGPAGRRQAQAIPSTPTAQVRGAGDDH